ncbi:hypothetical protein QMO16_29120, partial [Klebsiella pneumoniae]|uniref:hypothetical protein n=1 Tax=Klebsiella pneumoniae TaxID=573 RepID=UPI0024AF3C03
FQQPQPNILLIPKRTIDLDIHRIRRRKMVNKYRLLLTWAMHSSYRLIEVAPRIARREPKHITGSR